MKFYYGKRLGDAPNIVGVVKVSDNMKCKGYLLVHHIRHSPTGMEWGYLGSGPSDLALSILWDVAGQEPDRTTYMMFKDAFVGTWEDVWVISKEEIITWLKERIEVMSKSKQQWAEPPEN